jgi:hypothetical protein
MGYRPFTFGGAIQFCADISSFKAVNFTANEANCAGALGKIFIIVYLCKFQIINLKI